MLSAGLAVLVNLLSDAAIVTPELMGYMRVPKQKKKKTNNCSM